MADVTQETQDQPIRVEDTPEFLRSLQERQAAREAALATVQERQAAREAALATVQEDNTELTVEVSPTDAV